MQQEITNKIFKENLLENNDNHKIIVLPLLVQKQILYFLYKEFNYMDRDKIDKKEIENYFLINWDWFKYSQILFHHFFPLYYSDYGIDSWRYDYWNNYFKDRIIINRNKNNKFKLINSNFVKTIIIDYFHINNESINYINSLKSLDTINVNILFNNQYSLNGTIWILSYLNRLINKDMVVNFELEMDYDMIELPKSVVFEKEELLFKTNQFFIIYDTKHDLCYKFINEMIKELKPKSLRIEPIIYQYLFSSIPPPIDPHFHLQQYHSISKLNQDYESVEIIYDFIPLYALYRFLQAPKLQTLKFNLQFHFLSEIYDNILKYYHIDSNRDYINKDGMELDFNRLDNFDYKYFGGENKNRRKIFKVNNNIQFYIDNGINEDNQIFCPYENSNERCYSIPPYSKSLWNECLKLLSTNSTITNLSISHNCGGCTINSGLYNINFLNDFMNSLANNKTIKTLTLDFNFNEEEIKNNMDVINESIALMLDQNTTLESITICFSEKHGEKKSNKFPYTTKNTKCNIIFLK
ncbi:hypothetical protein ACTA71_007663 [Dictyostelium dimigraforme]